MSEASLIISVSNKEYHVQMGLAGEFVIPPRPPGADFSLLVIYPTPEIQNIGDGRKEVHWTKARPLAENIVGLHGDSNMQKWGVLLCAAEPDLPKSLFKAIDAEREYLDEHTPTVRYRRDKKTGVLGALNVYEDGEAEMREKLSKAVVRERDRFHEDCRKLVTREEIQRARLNLATEDGRLVAQADSLWAGNDQSKRNISELHKEACIRMGQQRPWCYTPEALVDCPGCGAKIKEGIVQCPSCHAMIDRDLDDYALMSREERAKALYPERYKQQEAKQPVGAK